MYGEIQKCEQQINSDKDFVIESEKKFQKRKKACEHYVSKGWEYYYSNDNDLSMKRFNQAWLLDKNNPQTYWGFGNILGKNNEYENSIKYFLKSIELDSYGQLFYKTKDIKYLNLTIENLKRAVKLEPNNGRIYGQLANSYSYFTQKDSLKKYIKITDDLNPKFRDPEIRETIKSK